MTFYVQNNIRHMALQQLMTSNTSKIKLELTLFVYSSKAKVLIFLMNFYIFTLNNIFLSLYSLVNSFPI